MSIAFACECGKQLRAADEHAGRLTKCPGCGRELTIPDARQAAAPRLAEAGPDDYRPRGTSGKAVASLLLGIASLVLCLWLVAGIPTFILGILGLKDISRSEGRLGGKGLAVTGLVLAGLATVLCPAALVVLVPYVVTPVVTSAREAPARAKCRNNLKELGLAVHNYHDTYAQLPAPAMRTPMPGQEHPHSWRVAILPFVEQDILYRQYRFDEPWDGPNNRRLLTPTPKVFVHPLADPSEAAAGLTRYRVFVGPTTALGEGVRPGGRPFEARRGTTFTEFLDGTSNTVLIVESAEPVPWTKPEDLRYDPNQPLPRMGGLFQNGFHVVTADGAVHFVRKDFKESSFRAAITRDGGEVLNWGDLAGR